MIPRCFGVLGHPIGHSRSPRMHQAAFDSLDLPHRYLAFDVETPGLSEALQGARRLGFGGLNLTVPLKRAALPCMDTLSPEAAAIGAVNTVCFTPQGLVGRNTDGEGFIEGVVELLGSVPERAVVLGGGGAARAVVYALTQHGCGVAWVSRRPEQLPAWPGATAGSYSQCGSAMGGAGLLVNATTVGMAGGPSEFPVALPLAALDPSAAVIDLVYPRPHGGLLEGAAEHGLRTQDGLPMLWGQGVHALQHWLGISIDAPTRAAMRRAIE